MTEQRQSTGKTTIEEENNKVLKCILSIYKIQQK